MNWLQTHIDEYYSFLKENTIVRENTKGWSTIGTPFIGLFNDCIEIYVKRENETIYLSDDGATISHLSLVGVNITKGEKRKSLLNQVLRGYGIELKKNTELCTTATIKNFAQKKHNLICAISEISDMSMLADHTIASLFKQDVKGYLDKHSILYTPHFIVKGSTSIEFTFDFQIMGAQREIVVRAFNSVNTLTIPQFLFGWEDIKSNRETITQKELMGLAIINDMNKKIEPQYIEALKQKNTEYIMWSERDTTESLEKFAA